MDKLLFFLAMYIATLSSILLTTLPLSHCQEDDPFTVCGSRLYSCGNLTAISYPFSGNGGPPYCGPLGFELECYYDTSFIQIRTQEFRVLNISRLPDYAMTLTRNDLFEDPCISNYVDTTLDVSRFRYLQRDIINVTVHYGCLPDELLIPVTPAYHHNFKCNYRYAFYEDQSADNAPSRYWSCQNKTIVPVILNPFEDSSAFAIGALRKALDRGFDVYYTADWTNCIACSSSYGKCGSDEASGQFSCICETGKYSRTCPSPPSPSRSVDHVILSLNNPDIIDPFSMSEVLSARLPPISL